MLFTPVVDTQIPSVSLHVPMTKGTTALYVREATCSAGGNASDTKTPGNGQAFSDTATD